MHVVRFGRLVWLIGTNLEHLYRFRYSQMIYRQKLPIPLLLLRGVCAAWEWSDVAVNAACASFAVTPDAVAAVMVQRGAECALVAARGAAVVRCVWALPICHLNRPLQMILSQSLGQYERGGAALRLELLLQYVCLQQQSAVRRRKLLCGVDLAFDAVVVAHSCLLGLLHGREAVLFAADHWQMVSGLPWEVKNIALCHAGDLSASGIAMAVLSLLTRVS